VQFSKPIDVYSVIDRRLTHLLMRYCIFGRWIEQKKESSPQHCLMINLRDMAKSHRLRFA
jgi:hypothetical protein